MAAVSARTTHALYAMHVIANNSYVLSSWPACELGTSDPLPCMAECYTVISICQANLNHSCIWYNIMQVCRL